MQPDLNRVIEQVSKEKGIDRGIIVKALEEAMLSAAKKTFGHEKNIEAKFNTELGEVELFEIKTVVEHVEDPENQVTLEVARAKIDPEAEVGDELLAKLPPEKFGRIAAQAAKQNIIQRVRDAERDIIYNEFKGRKGELFSGIVQRFEKKNIIVNLGRTDAILPEKEQIPRERYRQGDRIRAYILDVELTGKGPQIVLSRTHPGLLIKLFEQEVPEIYEGIVEVKGAAREPGGRAKIAVTSNDRDVDPVGACVGMRGTRVQAVVQELRGEKIDIVPWTSDPAEYVCRALAPAKVSKIIMDEDEHAMEVIVPDDQLALAIGKKGQNVRLASRLTGWKLDVRSEAEAEDEARRARSSLTAIPNVGDVTAELLYQSGFKSAEELAASDEETVGEIEGIGPERAGVLLAAAREHVQRLREQEALAAAEAAAVAAAAAAAAAAAGPGGAEESTAAPAEPVGEEGQR
ncbi:MAG: transcription termination/antitermination protein NusA [Deltaproteobacteria bacterium]|nr:MAG: transcription termination/antitermination protein NusA [Deltaproteobacteria bacterium]